MVGSIGLCENFWENEILSDHPDKQLLLSWLQGVRIELFFNQFTQEVYKGKKVEAKNPTPIQLKNYVPTEFASWVNTTIKEYKRIQMLVPWSEVRRENENLLPDLILP